MNDKESDGNLLRLTVAIIAKLVLLSGPAMFTLTAFAGLYRWGFSQETIKPILFLSFGVTGLTSLVISICVVLLVRENQRRVERYKEKIKPLSENILD